MQNSFFGQGRLIFTHSQPSFRLYAHEEQRTFRCRVDDQGELMPCGTDNNVIYRVPQPLADGRHKLEITVSDLAGNTQTGVSTLFDIDTTPPDTRFERTPPAQVFSDVIAHSFDLASTEEGVQYRCRFNGGRWEMCDDPYVRYFPASAVIAWRSRPPIAST